MPALISRSARPVTILFARASLWNALGSTDLKACYAILYASGHGAHRLLFRSRGGTNTAECTGLDHHPGNPSRTDPSVNFAERNPPVVYSIRCGIDGNVVWNFLAAGRHGLWESANAVAGSRNRANRENRIRHDLPKKLGSRL